MKDTETGFARWAKRWDNIDLEASSLGSVRFSQDKGARLFTPGESLLRLVADPPTDLFGISHDKTYILLNCIPGKTGPAGQEIISDTLLVGDREFDHTASVSKIEFELKGLEEWAQGFGTPSLRDLSAIVEKEPVLEKQLFRGEGKRIALRAGYLVSPSSSGSATFERICRIAIDYHQHVDLDQALDDAYAMLLLVSFCSGWYASFTKVRVVNALDESYDVVSRFKGDESQACDANESPISFAAFIDHCPELVAEWLECSADLKTAIYEYVPLATENRFIYGDLRIIAVSQVLDALGRALGAVAEESPEQAQKKERLKTQAKELPEGELKSWALKKLRKKPSATYKDRVRKILADIGEYVDDVLPDEEKFLDRQVELRNDFVHRNPSVSSHENEYLLYHTHIAMMLCQASIMKSIGFSESEIATGLARYKRNIKRRFASFYADPPSNQ